MIAQTLSDTTATIRNRLCDSHYQELKASALSDEAILNAGHFTAFTPQHGYKHTGYKHSGLIFEYLDPTTGKPYKTSSGKPFFRIKPDDWDKSEDDEYGDEPPKYLSPFKEGCRPYFSAILDNWQTIIKKARIPLRITEGEKKADSSCAHNRPCIGVAGVDAWLDSCAREGEDQLTDSRPLPELSIVNWEGRTVYLVFDSDVSKPSVRSALFRLASQIEEWGGIPKTVLLPIELDGSKNGLDDFIHRHGIDAYDALEKVATPAIKIDQRNGKKSLNLPTDPGLRLKAIMAWAILKERWAYRPKYGWYQWTGKVWKYFSQEEFEAELDAFMDAQNWDDRGNGTLTALSKLLKVKLLIADPNGDKWNPATKLIFQNGTLNATQNQFTPGHDRSDYATILLPYDYGTNPTCPNWLQFLNESLRGDTAAIEIIRAFFKWILVPKSKTENSEIEKCLDLVGPKGTGKSTLLDCITYLVGAENVAAISGETFKTATARAGLIDKKVALDHDAFGYLSDVGMFNKIVSNQPIEMRRLYKEVINDARAGVVLVRAYNRTLEVPDGSEGLDRRIIAFNLNHKPDKVDLFLGRRIRAEMPGIFAWCWSMSVPEMRRRLMWASDSPVVMEASIQRFEKNNPEYCFLRDRFPDGSGTIKSSELYDRYKDWCREEGHQAKKHRKFSEATQGLGCKHGTSGGYPYYQIPKMKDFDAIAHLGISRELKEEFPEVDDPNIYTKTNLYTSNPCPVSVRGGVEVRDDKLLKINNIESIKLDDDDPLAISLSLNSCKDTAGADIVLDFLKSLICSPEDKLKIWDLVPPIQQRRLKGKLPWDSEIDPKKPLSLNHNGQQLEIPAEYPGRSARNQTKEPKQIKAALLSITSDTEYRELENKYGVICVLWVLWRLIEESDRLQVIDVAEGRIKQLSIEDVGQIQTDEEDDSDDDGGAIAPQPSIPDGEGGGNQEAEEEREESGDRAAEEKCDRSNELLVDSEQTPAGSIFRVGDRVEVICPEGWVADGDAPTGSTGVFYAYKDKRNLHKVVYIQLDNAEKDSPVLISPARLKFIQSITTIALPNGTKIRHEKTGATGTIIKSTDYSYQIKWDEWVPKKHQAHSIGKYESQCLEDFQKSLKEGMHLKALKHPDHKDFYLKAANNGKVEKILKKGKKVFAQVATDETLRLFNLEAVQILPTQK